MNPTDWSKIEESENRPPYGDLPRKRAPMPKIKETRTLFVCGTDNDGFPTCQGDGTTCGLGGVCAELDPDPPFLNGGLPGVPPMDDEAVALPPDGFLMGVSADEDDDDPPFVLAKYDGYCSACGDYHILEGVTMIRADGNDGWEAEECAW